MAKRVVCKIPLLARALGLAARPSARATIGYLVYNKKGCKRGHAPGKKCSKRGQKGARRAKMQIGGEKGEKKGARTGKKGCKKGARRRRKGAKSGVGRLVSRPAFIYQVAGFTHLHARLHLMYIS